MNYPSTFRMDSITRSAWNGLTMKSLAPDWIASITIDCCPIAEHITHVAFGSAALISLSAWIPSLLGIVISKCYEIRLELIILWQRPHFRLLPLLQSQIHPLVRMSFNIILINAASSTIKILAMVLNLLFYNLFNNTYRIQL